jgi:hypothetical protein
MANLLGKIASWLRHRAEPGPLDEGHSLGEIEEKVKAALAAASRGAFVEGVSAEKARVCAILTAPGAATFPEIAMDLALGAATGAQAVAVLSRAETDAAKRAALLKSSLLERANAPAIH